jgi:hypothetical protein
LSVSSMHAVVCGKGEDLGILAQSTPLVCLPAAFARGSCLLSFDGEPALCSVALDPVPAAEDAGLRFQRFTDIPAFAQSLTKAVVLNAGHIEQQRF